MDQSNQQSGSSEAAKPPDRSLGFLLPRVAHSLERDFETMLSGFGIRTAHLGVLSTLRAYGPLPQRRIAEYLGLERQTLVNVTDELENKGLIQRGSSLQDRRIQLLQLTQAGLTFQTQVDQAAEQHENQVFGVLVAEEQEALYAILRKLAPMGHFETLFTPPHEE